MPSEDERATTNLDKAEHADNPINAARASQPSQPPENSPVINLFPQGSDDGQPGDEAPPVRTPESASASAPDDAKDNADHANTADADVSVAAADAPADAPTPTPGDDDPFDGETPTGARLLVVGVGGAGCNIVNHMLNSALGGVEFVALNTDTQALRRSRARRRLALGRDLTHGMGAGGNPAIGQQAAQESYQQVAAALTGADMVIIVAGMGGGTGTGASPIVAQAAREVGALTLGIVTTPFAFERRRRALAEQGVSALRSVVDAIIVAPNEHLAQLVGRDTGVFEAYRMADESLRAGVQGLSDLITIPGLINLDFADVRAVMRDAGSAYLAIGSATGDNRAETALRAALSNPLLDVDIAGARGLLFNVTGGDDLTMREVEEVADALSVTAHPEANLIFGATYDPQADGALRLTIVATGFEPHVASGARSSAWSPGRITLEPGGRGSRAASAGPPSAVPGRMPFDDPLPQLSQPPGGADPGWGPPPWAVPPAEPGAQRGQQPQPPQQPGPQVAPPNLTANTVEPPGRRGQTAAPGGPNATDQRVNPTYPREEYAENPDERGEGHAHDPDDRHGFWSRLFSSAPPGQSQAPNPPSSAEP